MKFLFAYFYSAIYMFTYGPPPLIIILNANTKSRQANVSGSILYANNAIFGTRLLMFERFFANKE